ncbi:MAG: NIPSNAP family protein [Candidatus Bathyarchaeota archaeon]|nr:NIPSNAP family protein [Candidatus Bathyarchaeota archaeon]MCZ2808449.1 hypothetical protein [Candidatus Bathyarchaeota archaeon]
MKVMLRAIMRMHPGKMAEGMELWKEMLALMKKKGISFPPARTYTPFLGGGDALHTIIVEGEWDSLAAVADMYEKSSADPEIMGLMPKWDAVEESHRIELYMVMPQEQG